jgi:hypothetical protein
VSGTANGEIEDGSYEKPYIHIAKALASGMDWNLDFDGFGNIA